jgi:putative nucleotidyltransferase with HDIG domain
MVKHCLASEAVLGALADHLGESREQWSMAGLLHDLDVEQTDAKTHGLKTPELLAPLGVAAEVVDAIRHHNEVATGVARTVRFHHALAAGETVTGLITATALIYPDKKVASVKAKSVTKRMTESRFAASVNRDTIRECEKMGMSLDVFVGIALKAMQDIGPELGL